MRYSFSTTGTRNMDRYEWWTLDAEPLIRVMVDRETHTIIAAHDYRDFWEGTGRYYNP